MTRWVLLSSWHILNEEAEPVLRENEPSLGKTLCGRDAPLKWLRDAPDPGDKTCEACFRRRESRLVEEEPA